MNNEHFLVGDNDWNDCPNDVEALEYWETEFLQFESRHWNHSFVIQRQPYYPSNFAFVHKGTLFIGLKLVGGHPISNTEWNQRLTDEVQWTISLIRNYTATPFSFQHGLNAGHRVVIFGHADPNSQHNLFFTPLRIFIMNELYNQVPILYMNGDNHEWLYEPNYMDQPSFVRIMVPGLGKEPPIKMTIIADARLSNVNEAFIYDRQL
jgi:hypothetical protein